MKNISQKNQKWQSYKRCVTYKTSGRLEMPTQYRFFFVFFYKHAIAVWFYIHSLIFVASSLRRIDVFTYVYVWFSGTVFIVIYTNEYKLCVLSLTLRHIRYVFIHHIILLCAHTEYNMRRTRRDMNSGCGFVTPKRRRRQRQARYSLFCHRMPCALYFVCTYKWYVCMYIL